ncbi:MAG: hypothetical protein QOK22_722, partial [Gaiellaceae bacterium]|nr:hypothetical protein [Gaiellaceae bacterium]
MEYFEAMAIAAADLSDLDAAVRGVLDRH